jgi:O-antigen ligase
MPDRFGDASQTADSDEPGSALVEWWRKGLFFFLCLSVLFLGTGGGVELPVLGVGVSAWSISRTTFFFWLIWKLLIKVRYGRWRMNWVKHPIPLSLLLFFTLVAISLLPDFHASGDFPYFLFGCVHAVMVMDLFDNRRRVGLLFLLLGLLPGLLTLRGILHDPSLLNLDRMRRFGFPLDHPNTAGYLFSMSLPLAVSLVLSEEGRLRWLSVVSCAAQLLGLVLTYSRGAWLGWGASMIFLVVMSKRWKAMLCVLLVPVLLYIFVEPLRNRVLTLAKPKTDVALSDRMRIMRDATELGYRNPVLGIGYGRGRLKRALRIVYQGTANETSPIWHAHNVYVELFAETGILGLAAFLWLLGRTEFEILRRAHADRNADRVVLLGVGAAWIAAAVTGLGDIPFYHHETRIFFFTLLALAFVSGRVGNLNGGPE